MAHFFRNELLLIVLAFSNTGLAMAGDPILWSGEKREKATVRWESRRLGFGVIEVVACLGDKVVNADFSDSDISGTDLSKLSRWTSITRMSLNRCNRLNDDSLHSIPNLDKLEVLTLFGTKTGMPFAQYLLESERKLAKSTGGLKLHTLGLSGPDWDDEALALLANIKSLKHISLHGSKVTQAGRQQIQELRPDLSISGIVSKRTAQQ